MKYQGAKTEAPDGDPPSFRIPHVVEEKWCGVMARSLRNGKRREEWRMQKGIRGILGKSLSPLSFPVVKTGGEGFIVTNDRS